MQLSDVAEIVGFKIVRDGEFKALGLLSDKRDLLLVHLYDHRFVNAIGRNPSISCVVTTPTLAELLSEQVAVGICDNPSRVFCALHDHLMRETSFYWNEFDSEIFPGARIHETANIAKKNVRIGEGALIEPNVTIHERCIIGKNVVIRSGSVIGGEGLEPKWIDGKHINVPHSGGVLIGDRVEIQSNCHVARSVYGGFTEIGDDTKLDALVHVAHNVVIGRGCEISACVMVAGSTIIGNNVWVGPNSSISSEINIGDDVYITLGSVVVNDVPEGQRVTGNFAVEHSKFLSFFWKIRKGWN